MKVLSLFSGVGGFDMGLENAGMETVFQCEWDKHANSILHKHWPDVPKWDDVSTLTGKHILANAPEVDVVAWGSPCQDLSVAGKRAGLEGGRSGLFHEGIRIIKELQEETNGQYPRISIWENVVGALNSNGGADFGVILDEMAEAGALVIEWAVLDAQYFGVPQRRRRVFVAAIFDPVLASRCPNPLLPVAESLPGHLTKSKPQRQSAARTLTEGTGTDGRIVNAIGASIYHKQTVVNQDVNSGHLVVGALAARDYKGVGSQYVNEGKVIVEPMLLDGTRVDDVRVYEPPVQTLKERMGTGGNNVPMLAFDTQFGSNANVTEDVAPTLKSSQQSPSVAYSIREDAKANTFSATELDHANSLSALRPSPQSHHAQMFIAEPTMAVRRLTPLECERLMGWPDDHTRYKADGTEQADTHRYKQCGNGVASPVAQWIAKHLLNI
jgi:DNA (cytosine-5)-methyltransferase 1